MTVTGYGNECLFTLGSETFVTQQLESAALTARLRTLRNRIVVLQGDAPYRCVGGAIITLQRAKAKFRTPSLGPPPAEQCRLLKITVGKVFKEFDRNGDGKLDRAEFQISLVGAEKAASRTDEIYHSTHEPLNADAEFRQRDLNSDGFIEPSEMASIPAWVAGTTSDVSCL